MLYNGKSSDIFVKVDRKEEQELFERVFNGDSEARERIITGYMPLIFRVIKDCVKHYTKEDIEDYISDGTIGLIKAVDTYRLDFGFKFMSYAYACIRNEIFMTFRKLRKRAELVPLDAPVKESFDGDILCGDDILVDFDAEEAFLRLEKVDIREKLHDLAWNLPDLERSQDSSGGNQQGKKTCRSG